MKEAFFTLLLFFMSSVSTLSAQDVVDYPSYRNHANYIEVYHVEAHPEYTLFETTVYNNPGYWIQMNSTDQLVGCQTGKQYRFLRVEGFEMDKQVSMPESGHRSFKIYFEPLDTQDKAIHWIENGKDTVFSTLNVRPVARPKGMFSCRIKGEVAGNKPCVRLLLADSFEDMRIISPLSIPVKDNKFDYTYYTNQPEVKHLIQWEQYSNGRWYDHPVFIEAGENEVIIEENSRFLKIKQGTPANVEWVELQNKRQQEREAAGINQLRKEMASIPESDVFTPEGRKLFERVKELSKNKEFTDEIAAEQKALFKRINMLEKSKSLYSKKYYDFMDEINSRGKIVNQRIIQDLAQQPSLANLYELCESIQRNLHDNSDEYLKGYEIYRKNFAKKWGTYSIGQHFESMVQAQLQMKVGQPYKNYYAEDFTGKPVSISEQIKGKWALIDLWASWCGSCRAKGRQMIPVYEKYKDSGFTIVGIAREKKLSDVQQALKKEKYPWMQLVEINDKNQIWLKHGIEYSGGATFLIDDKGIIVAINPKADEVQKILEKQLLSCCSSTQQPNKEWNRIDNQLYSINFPSSWVTRHQTEDGNGLIERDIKSLGYHYYCLMWGTPHGTREDIDKRMYCVIQSYEKLNPDSAITLQEIEELEMRQSCDLNKLNSKRIIQSSKNQKKFVIVRESQNLDKTTDILREYYLLQQKGKIVHCLCVTLPENYAQKYPEKISEIEKIIDSFTVK